MPTFRLLALIGSHQWRVESLAHSGPGRARASRVPRAAGRGAVAGRIGAGSGGGLAFGFVFGIAVGVASIPVTAFVLWRGVGARRLTIAAAVLLGVLVPLAYVLHPESSAGATTSATPTTISPRTTSPWAAIGLLIGALWRTLAASQGRRPRRGSRTSDASERNQLPQHRHHHPRDRPA